jgi:hypothetical protein
LIQRLKYGIHFTFGQARVFHSKSLFALSRYGEAVGVEYLAANHFMDCDTLLSPNKLGRKDNKTLGELSKDQNFEFLLSFFSLKINLIDLFLLILLFIVKLLKKLFLI